MQIYKRYLYVSALLFLFAFASGAIVYLNTGEHRAAMGLGVSRPIVIIDPGHGGADGGAVGVDGIAEKELNLAISKKLRTLLELGGVEVVMTRDSDVSIHDPSASTIRKQKTSDLRNRLAIAEGHPGSIFISIHQNKFTQSKYWGTQVFYSPNNPESRELAQLIQDSVIAQLQPDNTRKIKEAQDNLYLLYNANSPAVLVECGFLSNPSENLKLEDPQYQDALAFCIYMAIMEYYR